ncbi:MAG: FkbM family methyltransferase [Candidatus Methylomirabilales bacterium]
MTSPFTLVDVGARGGIDRRWHRFARHLSVVAIEADESAESGSNTPYLVFKRIRTAVSNKAGTADFYFTRKPEVSSFLPPNRPLLERFPDANRFDVVRVAKMEMTTLDVVLQEHAVDNVDFLKVDTQGSELLILEGGTRALASAVGLEVEVDFIPLYQGQCLFSDVDTFLKRYGFELFDLNRFYWRRRIAHHTETGRGQLVFADALYLKTPERLCSDGVGPMGKEKILWKTVIVAGAYGLFDYAFEVLREGWERGMINETEKEMAVQSLNQVGLGQSIRLKFPGREKVVRVLEKVCEVLRRDSWVYTDGRLANSRK